MATFFGEVIFPSSRAFWDEEEEEEFAESLQNKTKLLIRWIEPKPTNIEKFISLDGNIITDYMKKYLKDVDISEVCIVETEAHKKVSSIYKICEGVYLCIVLPDLDIKLSGEFVHKISDILSRAKCIISITSQHISQYKSGNIPNTLSFLRCLWTKNAEQYIKVTEKALEQPNIVYGVAAGVLSYAKIMKLPSVLYVLYADSFTLNSRSAEPLNKLLTEHTNGTLSTNIFHDRHIHTDFNKGNLYM